MKKITIALAMVAATMLTACSDPEEEAKEREAELAQQLTTETRTVVAPGATASQMCSRSI